MENDNNNGFNNETQQFGSQSGDGFGGQQSQTENQGQFTYGQNTNDQNINNQNTYGQNAYGQSTYGQNTYGQSAYGQNAYGQNAYGQNAYGQSAYGQNYGSAQPPMGDDGKQLQNRFGMKLVFSILEILTILSCNLLTGILGIIACVFTTKANTSFKEGRWDDFKSQAKTSAILLWIGFAGFVIELIAYIVLMVAGFSLANIALDEISKSGYTDEYDDYDDFDYDDDFYLEEDSETEIETETETETETQQAPAPTDVTAGTGFTDPTVSINGVSMTFPFSYEELKNMGFHISAEDEAYVLNSMYYTSVSLYNAEDESIGYCYLYDHTEDAISLSECMVYGVSLQYADYYDAVAEVVFPSGVTNNSVKEDWVTAYGEPDYVYESEDYDSQDYQWYIHNDEYYDDSQNSLEVSYWDGKIDEISIRYIGWD